MSVFRSKVNRFLYCRCWSSKICFTSKSNHTMFY